MASLLSFVPLGCLCCTMGVFKILLFILYHNDYYYFISPSLGSSPFSSGNFIRQQTPKSRLWSGAFLHFIMRIVLGTPLRPGFSSLLFPKHPYNPDYFIDVFTSSIPWA